MSQSGDLRTPHSGWNPIHQILINLPCTNDWWKFALAMRGEVLEIRQKNLAETPTIIKGRLKPYLIKGG